MSTNALRAATSGKTAAPAKQEAPRDLAHLLASPNIQSQIKLALPRHMTAERMARIATTELRRVPKLAKCDPASFLGAVIQCAQLGLEPGNALGHVYILPFDKRKKLNGQWVTERVEAQVIIGYRGMIDLARRSGQIMSLDAHAVYEGDTFECELGLESRLHHVPDWQNPNRADPAAMRFVYAVAKLKGGGVQFAVMSRAEIDGIRARSKSANDGPWVTDYVPMAMKTVIRRLFKYLPVSIELAQAITLDERAEAGLSQDTASVIEGESTVTDEDDDRAEPPQIAADERVSMTYAEVAGRLQRAKSADERDEAASLIALVSDEAQREELGEMYESLRGA